MFFLISMEFADKPKAAVDLLGVNPSILDGKLRSKKYLCEHITKDVSFDPCTLLTLQFGFTSPPAETNNKDFQ
jgi:hypothetical protein